MKRLKYKQCFGLWLFSFNDMATPPGNKHGDVLLITHRNMHFDLDSQCLRQSKYQFRQRISRPIEPRGVSSVEYHRALASNRLHKARKRLGQTEEPIL